MTQINVHGTLKKSDIGVLRRQFCGRVNSEIIVLNGLKYTAGSVVYTGFGGNAFSDSCNEVVGLHQFQTVQDIGNRPQADLKEIPGLYALEDNAEVTLSFENSVEEEKVQENESDNATSDS